MKFTPVNDWRWNYKDRYLSITLIADNGNKYFFRTHYQIDDLRECPCLGLPFCVQDASLLTSYQDGLSKINMNDGACLDLGINAVACERFVKVTAPVSRYFMPYNGRFYFERGDVISLYANDGGICDCMVLDEIDSEGFTRLMMLNQSYTASDGNVFRLGNMIRVRRSVIAPFRSSQSLRSVRYA